MVVASVCVYKPGCHGVEEDLLALRQCTVSLSSRQGDAGVGSLRSTSNERHRERSAAKTQEAVALPPLDAHKETVKLLKSALSPAQEG